MRIGAIGLCAVFAPFGPAFAWTSPVPDVVVYTLPGLRHAVSIIAEAWRAQTGVETHIFTSSPAGIAGLVRHRARADLVVADTATLGGLDALSLTKTQPRPAIGEDPYVVAANSATTEREQSAHRIFVTDPTTAASFDGQMILHRMSKDQAAPVPQQGVADTREIIRALLNEPGSEGILRASDLGGERRLHVLTIIPADIAPAARISAALVLQGQSGRAGDFLRFLSGPRAAAVWLADGVKAAP